VNNNANTVASVSVPLPNEFDLDGLRNDGRQNAHFMISLLNLLFCLLCFGLNLYSVSAAENAADTSGGPAHNLIQEFKIVYFLIVCFIGDVFAIVYSVKTHNANMCGKREDAALYSQKTVKFNFWAFLLECCLLSILFFRLAIITNYN
jgi:hypothetical protein